MAERATDRPPALPKTRPLEAHAEGSKVLKTTSDSLLERLSTGAQRAVDRFFDSESSKVHAILLDAALGLYHEGGKYARDTAKVVVGAYLGALRKKAWGADAFPEVTSVDVTAEIVAMGFDATEQEVATLCRGLGLPLAGDAG